MHWLVVVAALGQLPPGVERRTVIEKHGVACPSVSQSTLCDDPSVVEPWVDPKGELDRVTFMGRKPGKTMCSCGLIEGFRFVWQITVISADEAIAQASRRVADRAVTRLEGAAAP